MRSIESGGGGGTGWDLSCSRAYMVRELEEPRATPEEETGFSALYIYGLEDTVLDGRKGGVCDMRQAAKSRRHTSSIDSSVQARDVRLPQED